MDRKTVLLHDIDNIKNNLFVVLDEEKDSEKYSETHFKDLIYTYLFFHKDSFNITTTSIYTIVKGLFPSKNIENLIRNPNRGLIKSIRNALIDLEKDGKIAFLPCENASSFCDIRVKSLFECVVIFPNKENIYQKIFNNCVVSDDILVDFVLKTYPNSIILTQKEYTNLITISQIRDQKTDKNFSKYLQKCV